jgi:dissimilatory sulfite reductase (desulfoviridin) alpha/beta subunit
MTEQQIHVDGTPLSAEEIKAVKALGCLRDKRYPDVFNVRVITRNGRLSVREHRDIADAAERFGSGFVTMTTRLTMEIQGVSYNNIQPMIAYLKERGLDCGGTGALVRPVVSCKGTTCQYGLIDTFALSEKIHERFYLGCRGMALPHKFKIAVGGCPNNCVKPELNDLGVIGQKVPVVNPDKCRGCKKCQLVQACPVNVPEVVDGKVRIDPALCNNCGRCEGKCPFGAVEDYISGYKVCIGGRWGKRVAHGIPLNRIFTSEEEVLEVIERTIHLFRDEGISGERLSDTVSRLGFEYVQEKLLSGLK